MKRIILYLVGIFITVSPLMAVELEDIPPERVYLFNAEFLRDIPQRVFGDATFTVKQGGKSIKLKVAEEISRSLLEAAAKPLDKKSDFECSGCISGTDIVNACIAGNLKARSTGLSDCLNLFEALCAAQGIEDDWDFNMFCPGEPDRNAKLRQTPIGAATIVGEFCSSDLIEGGRIVLKPNKKDGEISNYGCTCQPYACKCVNKNGENFCYKLENYQCHEKVDINGFCARFEKNFVLNSYSTDRLVELDVISGPSRKIAPGKNKNLENDYQLLEMIAQADQKAKELCSPEGKGDTSLNGTNCKIYSVIAEPVEGTYQPGKFPENFVAICNPSEKEVTEHFKYIEKLVNEITKEAYVELAKMQPRKYHDVCLPKNKVPGERYECVYDFEDIKLTPSEATGLAKAYMVHKKHKPRVPVREAKPVSGAVGSGAEIRASQIIYDWECDEDDIRTTADGHAYLKCRSKDDNRYYDENANLVDPSVYYEFRFGSLDNSAKGDSLHANAARGFCKIFNGVFIANPTNVQPYGMNEYNATKGDYVCKLKNETECSDLHFALRDYYTSNSGTYWGQYTGWFTKGSIWDTGENCIMLMQGGNLNFKSLTFNDLRNDFVPRGAKREDTIKRDNFICARADHNQFMSKHSDIQDFLRQYVAYTYGLIDTKGFQCDYGKQRYQQGAPFFGGPGCGMLGVATDDVVSCKLNGKYIDFVFDDLNEFNKKLSMAGISALTCMVSGMEVNVTSLQKGTKCTALDEKQCKSLNAKLEAENGEGNGADWDTKKESCILKSAKAVRIADFAKDMGIGVVFIVGGVVVAVATDGTAVPVLIMGGTQILTSGGLYAVDELEERAPAKIFREFVEVAKKCKDGDKNADVCAANVLNKYYNQIQEYSALLSSKVAEEAEEELYRLISLLEVGDVEEQGENDIVINLGTKTDKKMYQLSFDLDNGNLALAGLSLAAITQKFTISRIVLFAGNLFAGGRLNTRALNLVFSTKFAESWQLVRSYRLWKTMAKGKLLSGFRIEKIGEKALKNLSAICKTRGFSVIQGTDGAYYIVNTDRYITTKLGTLKFTNGTKKVELSEVMGLMREGPHEFLISTNELSDAGWSLEELGKYLTKDGFKLEQVGSSTIYRISVVEGEIKSVPEAVAKPIITNTAINAAGGWYVKNRWFNDDDDKDDADNSSEKQSGENKYYKECKDQYDTDEAIRCCVAQKEYDAGTDKASGARPEWEDKKCKCENQNLYHWDGTACVSNEVSNPAQGDEGDMGFIYESDGILNNLI